MSANPLASIRDRVLEWPWVYRAWQAPFAEAKLRPFLSRANLSKAQRVLDVGCGPGTNARHFAHTAYVGVDINPEYIAQAQRRYAGRFLVGDVTDPSVLPEERFDVVFANSLMHHLPDDTVNRLLSRMATLTTDDGQVHILDLILPERTSVARWLAKADRGQFARPVEAWRTLFTRHLKEVHSAVYPLGVPGVPMWWMIHFVGKRA
jgi:SAM-dependent methyltransferase